MVNRPEVLSAVFLTKMMYRYTVSAYILSLNSLDKPNESTRRPLDLQKPGAAFAGVSLSRQHVRLCR